MLLRKKLLIAILLYLPSISATNDIIFAQDFRDLNNEILEIYRRPATFSGNTLLMALFTKAGKKLFTVIQNTPVLKSLTPVIGNEKFNTVLTATPAIAYLYIAIKMLSYQPAFANGSKVRKLQATWDKQIAKNKKTKTYRNRELIGCSVQ